jgi:ABC-type sugar transport system permease subunit
VRYIGFENFTRVFTDDALRAEFLPALWRTVRFTIMNYLMVYVFGLALALLMYDIGFRGGLFTMIYMPAMISGLAVGFIATLLFSEATGVVNLLLVRKLGWLAKPINIKTGTGTTVILPILVGWRAAGFNMAIFLSGLLSIPRETIEASIVDGATYWQRLWRVYFPQMIPSFLMATIYCLTGSFGVFSELVALGGLEANDKARFLSIIIFQYGFSRNRLALGMALSLEVFLPLSIGAMLMQRLQRRFTYQL